MEAPPLASEPTVIALAIEAAGGPAVVARLLGVTTQAVCFWRDGERAVPEKHGADIERACSGAYTRKDLWPDTWRRIWPELDVEEAAPSAAVRPLVPSDPPAKPFWGQPVGEGA